MEVDTERANHLNDDEEEIDVDDDVEDIDKRPASGSGNRNGFFIQDILRPEFGNKQLNDQYYAYLQYCYSLQMHNMMMLHGAMSARNQNSGIPSDSGIFLNNGIPPSAVTNLPQQKMISPFPIVPIARKLTHAQRLKLVSPPSSDHLKERTLKYMHLSENTCMSKIDDAKDKATAFQRHSFHSENNTHKSLGLNNNVSQQEDGDIIGIERLLNKNSNTQIHSPNSVNKPQNNQSFKDLNSPTHQKYDTSKHSSPEGSVGEPATDDKKEVWPAWVYCTRYSDRPSSGPRSRKVKRKEPPPPASTSAEKRPRIAFTNEQLSRLKREFDENRYLTEERRAKLAEELDLTDAQVKIWFQNKRAKLKKTSGLRNPLALSLMAQGLYNHATVSDGEC